ncbi:MAG: NAD(P)-dependent oxidoreductase, partial [Pseudomonadales bacterium]
LVQEGIEFADAKGTNANAVVEYCLTAFAYLRSYYDGPTMGCQVGVIGAGAVGSRLLRKLRALGFETLAFDPLLTPVDRQDLESIGVRFGDLAAVLASSVVSLHVPLTTQGPHPTFHMLADKELDQLIPNAILINTSRGEVIDSVALKRLLASRPDVLSVIDVWDGEPKVEASLVEKVDLATPHIAGYSFEAKLAATLRLARALSEHYELEEGGGLRGELAPNRESISGKPIKCSTDLDSLLLEVFPLRQISDEFKRNVDHAVEENLFDLARARQVDRHEFSHYQIAVQDVSPPLRDEIETIGFVVTAPD